MSWETCSTSNVFLKHYQTKTDYLLFEFQTAKVFSTFVVWQRLFIIYFTVWMSEVIDLNCCLMIVWAVWDVLWILHSIYRYFLSGNPFRRSKHIKIYNPWCIWKYFLQNMCFGIIHILLCFLFLIKNVFKSNWSYPVNAFREHFFGNFANHNKSNFRSLVIFSTQSEAT